MLARVFTPVALSCLLLALVCRSCAMHTIAPVEHDFKKPAFISFLPEVGEDAMLVTSFDILCSHCNVMLVNTSTMQSTTLAALDWPNAVTFCPASVCSKPSLLVRMRGPVTRLPALARAAFPHREQVGFGFLTPGHHNGGNRTAFPKCFPSASSPHALLTRLLKASLW